MFRLSAALAAVTLVVGCAPRMAPPPAFAAFATDYRVAESLAASCPGISLDQSAIAARGRALGPTLAAQGYTQDQINGFQTSLDIAAIEGQVQAYMTDNGVDLRDAATACPVARAEIDSSSPIGAFLTTD